MSLALEVRDLSFRTGGKDVLRGVSFSAESGDYLSIIGPNGAGKTTLLKCVLRLHSGWTGEILIHGRRSLDYSRRELARTVSYVPQSEGQYCPFSALEFILMSRYPYGGPFSSLSREDRRAAGEAMALTGTEDLARRLLSSLSGGERQKVYIAAAMAQEAPIMLLDEPTTFLDPRHQAEVHSALGRLNREKGVTVVSVTHDVNGAVQHGAKAAALKEGRVVFDGTIEELTAGLALEEVYGVPFIRAPHPASNRPLLVPMERK